MSTIRRRVLAFGLPWLLVALVSTLSSPGNVHADIPDGAVIDNTITQLGVGATGALHVPSDSEDDGGIALRFLAENELLDVLAPGSPCEGWGVADGGADPFSAWATSEECAGWEGLEVDEALTTTFGDDSHGDSESVHTNFRSVVTTTEGGDRELRVTHEFLPAPENGRLYRINVRIQNIGTEDVENLLYRRVMDWDYLVDVGDEEPWFVEYVKFHLGGNLDLLRATNNSFVGPNPLEEDFEDPDGCDLEIFDRDDSDTTTGPCDQGALFDFEFGLLEAGRSLSFTLYYGGGFNVEDIETAFSDVSAVSWSIAIPASYNDETEEFSPETGGPQVFGFGYKRVPTTGLLEVRKDIVPDSIPGVFNLLINQDATNVYTQSGVGDNGTTGEQELEAGTYIVRETAGAGTALTSFGTSISCRDEAGEGSVVASANGTSVNVTLEPEDEIVCVITNTLALPASCAGMTFDRTIYGTDGNDTINGTGLRELIYGFGGNDTINGGAGNDCLVGGEGNDTLNGGAGNDKVVGDGGNDTLRGDSGIDAATGGLGTDNCDAESEGTCEI